MQNTMHNYTAPSNVYPAHAAETKIYAHSLENQMNNRNYQTFLDMSF